MECLTGLIGITNNDCPCVTAGLNPEDVVKIKTSVSGLYLDGSLEGGISLQDIKILENCGEYFKFAKKAIDNAIVKFRDDLTVILAEKYKSKRPTFKGDLGRGTYASNLDVSQNYQFMKIIPVSSGSYATLTIKKARLVTNYNGQITVYLIKSLDDVNTGEIIGQYSVNSVANSPSLLDLEPMNLPLSENGYTLNYYFVWQRPDGTAKPKDNKVSCGCSGGDAYQDYVELKGGETNSLTSLVPTTKYAHGFIIDAELSCNVGGIVCKDFDPKNEIAITTAWALLYKAGELLIGYVLSSGEISRFTMMNRDYLYGCRNSYKKNYEVRMAYLKAEMDVTQTDCFICKDVKMSVGNVFGVK